MAKGVFRIFFGVLIFQHVIAAPSDIKLEDIAEVTQSKTTQAEATQADIIQPEATLAQIPEEQVPQGEITQAEEKTDTNPETLLEETPKEAMQNQRQKRWYNYYGFPPVNPGFYNRDDSFNTGGFGLQDPLFHIHRRLQDITNSFRQQPLPHFPPPSLPQIPAFIPVFYVPQAGCACTPGTPAPRPFDPNPRPGPNNQNGTDPDVEKRWPEMEDERQNWGIVNDDDINQGSGNDEEEGDGDGSRPISFDPIRPNRPMNRPAPPVEHGSTQGDVNSVNAGTTTTNRPGQASNRPGPPPNSPPPSSNRPALPSPPGLQPPSNCDSAILKCCLLPQVTYDCFALQGCPDPSAYGYPCDNGVISRVIDRFLRFYGQRNG